MSLASEVCAPPELPTITPWSSVVTVADARLPESSDGLGEVVDGPVPLDPVASIDEEVDSAVDGDAGSDVVERLDVVEGDGESDPDEDWSAADGEESSAQATPGLVTTAPPTPSATAKAPTRPMYLA